MISHFLKQINSNSKRNIYFRTKAINVSKFYFSNISNVLQNFRRVSNSENSKDIIVLFCDIQDKYIPNVYGGDLLVTNSEIVADFTNIFQYSSFVTEHVPKTFGKTPETILSKLKNPPVKEKSHFPMMKETEVEKEKLYVLVGLETQICVFQTSDYILKKNPNLIVLRDCVSSSSEFERNRGLENLEKMGAVVTSMQNLFMYVMEDSSHPKFKEVLPLIKRIVKSNNKTLI
mmetsp:Transcript_28145/g.29338  ORF Transcript_28145/g.29338 Transcript_28145/m.29338 type:complete len:231 (+) Transcript_28145:3-695(+)